MATCSGTTPVSPDRQQISGNASVKKEEKDTSDLVIVLSEDLDSAFIGRASPTQGGLKLIFNEKGKFHLKELRGFGILRQKGKLSISS